MKKWVTQRNLAILALAGALVAFLAGFFGHVWPPLDILSHMRTHFLGGCLVAFAAVIWSRVGVVLLGGGAVAVLLVHAGVAWVQQQDNALAGLFGMERAVAATSADHGSASAHRVKVLSYNTWHSNRSLGTLQERILRSGADIVMLYEFGPNKRPMLEAFRSAYPHQVECATHWFCSVVILSKYPITGKRVLRRTGDRAPTVVAQLRIGARPLTVVGTHLFRPIDGPRRQMREIRSLARTLDGIEGDVLVGGDFNATRWSHALKTLITRAALTSGPGFLPSWPRMLPQLAIDHVFVRGDLSIRRLELAANGTADHIAISGEIELR